MFRQPGVPLSDPFQDLAHRLGLPRQGVLIRPPLKCILHRNLSSAPTVRVLSTNTSKGELVFSRAPLGRPLGLPLRPLGNQPGFEPSREVLLTTPTPQDVAQDLFGPTSVRPPRRHRPDRCRPRGSAARSARPPPPPRSPAHFTPSGICQGPVRDGGVAIARPRALGERMPPPGRRLLFSLGYGCGLRAGEVVRLKVKHIDRPRAAA
jgi:hypothetical protein